MLADQISLFEVGIGAIVAGFIGALFTAITAHYRGDY